jgi:hypothetical protein
MPDPTEPAHCALARYGGSGNLPSQALTHRESITTPDADDLRRMKLNFVSKMHAKKSGARREPKNHSAVG